MRKKNQILTVNLICSIPRKCSRISSPKKCSKKKKKENRNEPDFKYFAQKRTKMNMRMTKKIFLYSQMRNVIHS